MSYNFAYLSAISVLVEKHKHLALGILLYAKSCAGRQDQK